ncbi:MAG: putative ABC exporter domain-containing protein [Ruminococcus sp.]|jgi:hypothetical protein|nr:putative ABC exporter domain-containing protein [Ruminococcus sp.]
MKSLFYIFIKTIKNFIKEFFKKPLNTIFFIFMIGLLILMMFLPKLDPTIAEDAQPVWILKAIMFAYSGIYLLGAFASGFKNGASMFEMSDINMVFTGPIISRHVLIYGMLKSVTNALLLCIMVIWQSVIFAMFGYDGRGIFITVLLFMFVMVICQFLQMVIYLLTFGRKKRRVAVGIIGGAMFIPLVIKAIYEFTTQIDFMVAAERTVNSPYFNYVPVIGWMSGASADFGMAMSTLPDRSGDIAQGFVLVGLLVLAIIACAVFIIRSKADFYEDAIIAGETRFAVQRDLAEGNVNNIYSPKAHSKKPLKLKKTGVGGSGANAFLFRQLREAFRESFFGLWGGMNIFQICVMIGFGVGISLGGNDGIGELTGEEFMLFILAMLSFTQIVMVSIGRGMRELLTHFIYMVPENPLKKIIWANMTTLIKTAVEAVLYFGIIGIAAKASIPLIIACILCYTAFTFYYVGLQMAFERIELASKGLMLGVFFLVFIAFMSPGAIAGIIVGIITNSIATGVFIISAWLIIAGFISFAIGKGVLHNMDIPTQISAK